MLVVAESASIARDTEPMTMPHVIVEYSANLEAKIRIDPLLQALHETVERSGIAELAGIRTRAQRREHFRVADNDPANAFMAIYVRVAQGRDLETRQRLADLVFKAASEHLAPVFANTPLALSTEVQEIDPTVRLQTSNIRDWMKTREAAA
jgi:5-carboxymethyl-2-hydroxymuconate isomerase